MHIGTREQEAIEEAIAAVRADGGTTVIAVDGVVSIYARATKGKIKWELAEDDGPPIASGSVPRVVPAEIEEPPKAVVAEAIVEPAEVVESAPVADEAEGEPAGDALLRACLARVRKTRRLVTASKGDTVACAFMSDAVTIRWDVGTDDVPGISGTAPLVVPAGNDVLFGLEYDDAPPLESPDEDDAAETAAAAERERAESERKIYAAAVLAELLDLTPSQQTELLKNLERSIADRDAFHLLKFPPTTFSEISLLHKAREQDYAKFMSQGLGDRLLHLTHFPG